MRQGSQGQSIGITLRDRMGREVGRVFRMADIYTPMADLMSMYDKNHQNIAK